MNQIKELLLQLFIMLMPYVHTGLIVPYLRQLSQTCL
jgi:hypothetical protein